MGQTVLWEINIDSRQEGSLQNTFTLYVGTFPDSPVKTPQLESSLSSSNRCCVLSKQQLQEIRTPDCVLMIPPEEQKH